MNEDKQEKTMEVMNKASLLALAVRNYQDLHREIQELDDNGKAVDAVIYDKLITAKESMFVKCDQFFEEVGK